MLGEDMIFKMKYIENDDIIKINLIFNESWVSWDPYWQPINRDVNDVILNLINLGWIPTITQSCCNGPNNVRWNSDKARWDCKDCGSPASTDANYLNTRATANYIDFDGIDLDLPVPNKPITTKKCTCGSASLGSDKHSDWCDGK